MAHTYSYDQKNRLTNLGVNGPSGPLKSYAYTLDNAGHRTAVTELSGRAVNYAYDNIYRLTSEAVASDPAGNNGTIGYTYDAVGNRTQQTSTNPAISTGGFSYDADDRLTTDSYDANGNTTGSGGLTYAFDFENHLIQQGGATFVYDGDGNRVQKIVAGVTTKYLVATVNPTGYPQVVYQTFSGTGITEYWRQFVYGLDRISQYRSTQAGTQKSFYVYDGHGSVRALTDGSGNVTDTYDYDAFGNVTHQTGTTPNEFLFAGEQYDTNLHLYYNRARYLNTSTGRFWTMDTYEGDSQSPLSLHKYLYSDSDPANGLDPSGLQDFVDELAGEAVDNTLNAMSVIQRGAILGGLFGAGVGCVQGALGSTSTCASGAVNGALYGTLFGALAATGPIAQVTLSLAGTGLGGWAAYSAYRNHEYGLAAFDTVAALGSAFLATVAETASSPNEPPGTGPQPITNPSQLLPPAPPGYVQPWDGPITAMVLENDEVGYQVSPTPDTSGSEWFFAVRPATAAEAIRSGGLPQSNTAAYVRPAVIPGGTLIQIGVAAEGFQPGGGGAVQIQVLGGLPPSAFGPAVPLPPGE